LNLATENLVRAKKYVFNSIQCAQIKKFFMKIALLCLSCYNSGIKWNIVMEFTASVAWGLFFKKQICFKKWPLHSILDIQTYLYGIISIVATFLSLHCTVQYVHPYSNWY